MSPRTLPRSNGGSRTQAFLDRIAHPRYHAIAFTMLRDLERHGKQHPDGPLHPDFRLDQLAHTINRRCRRIQEDADLTDAGARASRVVGTPAPAGSVPPTSGFRPTPQPPAIPDSATVSSADSEDPPSTSPLIRGPFIQGFDPVAARIQRLDEQQSSPTQRGDPPQGRRSRQVPRYEGNCNACGRWGHKASGCYMLAMASLLQKYWDGLTSDTPEQVEEAVTAAE